MRELKPLMMLWEQVDYIANLVGVDGGDNFDHYVFTNTQLQDFHNLVFKAGQFAQQQKDNQNGCN